MPGLILGGVGPRPPARSSTSRPPAPTGPSFPGRRGRGAAGFPGPSSRSPESRGVQVLGRQPVGQHGAPLGGQAPRGSWAGSPGGRRPHRLLPWALQARGPGSRRRLGRHRRVTDLREWRRQGRRPGRHRGLRPPPPSSPPGASGTHAHVAKGRSRESQRPSLLTPCCLPGTEAAGARRGGLAPTGKHASFGQMPPVVAAKGWPVVVAAGAAPVGDPAAPWHRLAPWDVARAAQTAPRGSDGRARAGAGAGGRHLLLGLPCFVLDAASGL